MVDSAEIGSASEIDGAAAEVAKLRKLYGTAGDNEQEWADLAARASIEGRTEPARPNVPRAARQLSQNP